MKKAILADVQMIPQKFLDMGYSFQTPDIENALKQIKDAS